MLVHIHTLIPKEEKEILKILGNGKICEGISNLIKERNNKKIEIVIETHIEI